jgi:hypothetical protein
MIRRLIWLAVGAVLGITGYRRLTRAAKSLLPSGDLLAPLGRRPEGSGPARRASAGAQSRAVGAGTVAFVRDVRAGMAEYLDRHRDI